MKAIAIFERRDDVNVFLFPVLIDVDLTPTDLHFDLFGYKGRAYQALSDVDYTDSENAISDAATSPALDAIIPFGSLPTKVIHMVVQKFVMQLEAQLAERNKAALLPEVAAMVRVMIHQAESELDADWTVASPTIVSLQCKFS